MYGCDGSSIWDDILGRWLRSFPNGQISPFGVYSRSTQKLKGGGKLVAGSTEALLAVLRLPKDRSSSDWSYIGHADLGHLSMTQETGKLNSTDGMVY